MKHVTVTICYYTKERQQFKSYMKIIQCLCFFQPCGSTTPWHCSLVWVLMCSGAIYLLTATTKRTHTGIKTPWLQLEPFRHSRERYTLWMNSQQTIGTFTGAVWSNASKSGHTVTVWQTQLHRRALTVRYPAVNSPNLDECPEKCGITNKTRVAHVMLLNVIIRVRGSLDELKQIKTWERDWPGGLGKWSKYLNIIFLRKFTGSFYLTHCIKVFWCICKTQTVDI